MSRAVLLIAVLCFTACASFAPPDEDLTARVDALRHWINVFLVDLERSAGTPEGELARHTAFYGEVQNELTLLTARAQASGNRRTVAALELLATNIGHLQTAHGQGLTAAEVPVLRELFSAQLGALSAAGNGKGKGKGN